MKQLLAALAVLFLAVPVFAGDTDCLAQATEKKLSGAAKNSFIKKCVRDTCEAAAKEKKLAGAAKASFTKKCLSDRLQPYCEDQAGGKKLAGAAKTSFMNKCLSGD